ncbi:DUF262 domain-containing protein [Vineibacter terrae]|uniref:DUF262 domain-containing protein n=1 Tax=Vineibacter terrae TaxID=2586908 RepID=A0A5C8PKB9_9HYPH|nr:DUF262 domain-containing protein [Vineibacter terrae]TXL74084.1 DUF262 domain-containing protein [Vineibacter terrae]
MSQTVFTKVDFTLGALMDSIQLGSVGLPDIQRPFVWKNAKVRNLFDSMYRGFPVGYLLFWENANVDGSKTIGTDGKQKVPQMLIVDGQQRLTSLYAVIKGVPVVRENYDSELIEIAFNPLLERFEVSDAAIRKDKSFISNISILWSKNVDLFELVDEYLDGLKTVRDITPEERTRIRKAFTKLQNLLNFPFTTLALSAGIDEEQVSEVFVRINSEGKTLNQADFILTLMSVFWDEGRAQLEDFCRQARKPGMGPSPFNHFIQPDPDQLLRVCVGLGFRRARLQYVYSILRGKDLDSGQFSAERRERQFEVLKQAQSRVLNLTYWHDFLKAILLAGFRSDRMISSKNNLLFAYILYLLGRTEYGVAEPKLRQLIAQWFFMTALTGRYSSSPESKMEFDLARLRVVNDADVFVSVLEDICGATLTNDYWSITLPSDLATAAANSPSMFAYFAALNLHDARVLFSRLKVAELMDPATRSNRSALERHHLFPKAHLRSLGIVDLRDVNQIANFTMIEWGDDSDISDAAPSAYLPVLRERVNGKDLARLYYWHALPESWEAMTYHDFLRKRRELMAGVIRDAYKRLAGELPTEAGKVAVPPVESFVKDGEGVTIEFKSTLRTNLHTGDKDPKMELAVLKTIAAFLNTQGGTLVVGVADDGNPVGIDADKFPNEDRMNLHLTNLVKERIGSPSMLYVHPRFDDYQDTRVMVVECLPGRVPVFVRDGSVERFYIRTGAATSELSPSQTQNFVAQRFAA